MKKLPLLFLALLLSVSCQQRIEQSGSTLVSMQIIDRNGFSETIGSKERLTPYKKVDFLSAQPYQKVVRVFSKNNEGKSSSTLTTYHPNGHICEYLDIVDGRAHGKYRRWHANGTLNIDLNVLDGTADIGPVAQKSWLFDGKATIYDETGGVTAKIFYNKGVLDTPSLYYHPNGHLQKRSPFVSGSLHGIEEIFDPEGKLIEKRTFQCGKQEGLSIGYWGNETIQFEEEYTNDLLHTGSYFNPKGERVSSIEKGTGFKALFNPQSGALAELHEFTGGSPDGIVKIFNKEGALAHSYRVKDGMKHGEEWEYYPSTDPQEPPKPKLMVTWSEDMLQGAVKTWYPHGVQESSREMHQNKKQGYSFAWYTDGSLLLSEEYNQDALVKGSYFEKGNKRPISKVEGGKGTVTLYDSEGKLCKKIPYDGGSPVVSHD